MSYKSFDGKKKFIEISGKGTEIERKTIENLWRSSSSVAVRNGNGLMEDGRLMELTILFHSTKCFYSSTISQSQPVRPYQTSSNGMRQARFKKENKENIKIIITIKKKKTRKMMTKPFLNIIICFFFRKSRELSILFRLASLCLASALHFTSPLLLGWFAECR